MVRLVFWEDLSGHKMENRLDEETGGCCQSLVWRVMPQAVT